MSGTTPSRKRREGREAFAPDCDPSLYNPYKKPWDRENWLDGWNQERSDHESLEKERVENDWAELSSCCPWKDDNLCSPLNSTLSELCSKENCAPYYFRSKS